MGITYVGEGTPSVATGNPTPSYPAGLQAGDFMVAHCFSSGLTSPSASGATPLAESEGTTSNQQLLVLPRATGGESGTVAVTQSGANLKVSRIHAWRGVLAVGTPYEGFASAAAALSATTQCPDAVATGPGLAVQFTSKDSLAATPTTPAGWTERGNFNTTTSTDATLHVFEKLLAAAGTEPGPAVSYANANECHAQVLILIPEPDAGSLDAAAHDVAAASAGLNTSIKLGAAAADQASASAALTAAIRLAAAAVSSATATGVLSTQIRLGASAQDVATAQGSFGGGVLQAAATDVATAVAALSTSVRLGGAALDQAAAAGTFTNWATVTIAGVLYTGAGSVLDPNFWLDDVPQLGTTVYYDPTNISIAPNGEISSDSNDCQAVVQFLGPNGWALGLLIVTPNMVGYSRGQATASAQLTTAIQLAAAANALATAAASLSTGSSMAAAAFDVATATANLLTNIPLSALASSVASATAALTAQIKLAAAAAAQASASGNLNGVITINAAGQAISSAVASLTTQIQLAAAAQANAAAVGALSAGIRMDAVAQSIVSAAAALATSITFGGSANSVVSASGSLTTARPIIAAAIDVATALATLSTGISLRANAAAIAQASAKLESNVELLAAATAESTASAELTDVIATPPIGAYETDPRYVVTRPRWAFLPLLIFTPRFSRKDPADAVVLTFDLTSSLAANEKLQGPITLTLRTLAGSDASPQTLQRDVPSYDVARKKILLPVAGGLNGRWYYIKVAAATSNPRKSVSLAGLLPVME